MLEIFTEFFLYTQKHAYYTNSLLKNIFHKRLVNLSWTIFNLLYIKYKLFFRCILIIFCVLVLKCFKKIKKEKLENLCQPSRLARRLKVRLGTFVFKEQYPINQFGNGKWNFRLDR